MTLSAESLLWYLSWESFRTKILLPYLPSQQFLCQRWWAKYLQDSQTYSHDGNEKTNDWSGCSVAIVIIFGFSVNFSKLNWFQLNGTPKWPWPRYAVRCFSELSSASHSSMWQPCLRPKRSDRRPQKRFEWASKKLSSSSYLRKILFTPARPED